MSGQPTTQGRLLYRYLDTNGNGTGTKNATGDYSSVADIFYIQPAAGEIFRINRMLVFIEDTSGMAAADYGNITGNLTNGITVREQNDSGTITDLTDGVPIKSNGQWAQVCYDANLLTWGNGNEFITVRWTFGQTGQEIRLDGDENERLEVVLNDDLTGLVSHYFMVQGYEELVFE